MTTRSTSNNLSTQKREKRLLTPARTGAFIGAILLVALLLTGFGYGYRYWYGPKSHVQTISAPADQIQTAAIYRSMSLKYFYD